MKEFDLFFKLIRDSLRSYKKQSVEVKSERNKKYAENWENLYNELEMQAILVLPYKYVRTNVELSPEDMSRYHQDVLQTATNFYFNMQAQDEVVRLFKENGIPAAILKGSAASVYYPDPEIREMGDIDIITKPEDFERAYNLLCDNGFDAEPFDPGKRHNELFKNGFEVELHNAFATLKNEDYRKYLDDLIYKGIDESFVCDIKGFQFPMLPHHINGLTLLCHTDYHMEEGPGVRHLLDWMFFVKMYLDDRTWKDQFEKEAENIGLKTMAKTLTKCCQKYLGLTKSITWCNDADEELCDELMEFIMHFGNFGVKQQDNVLRGNILYMMKKPLEYIKFAQTFGLRTWKVLDKLPWLKPFAWIYQSFRFLSHGIRKGSGLSNSMDDYKMMERKNNLLNKIKSNK